MVNARCAGAPGGTAVVVTIIALVAIAASVVAGGYVLSRDEVARADPDPDHDPHDPGNSTPTGATPTTSAPESTGSTTTTTAPGGAAGSAATAGGVTPTDRIVSVRSGSVTVRCEGNVATLLSWSPNPGYRADDPVRGPATTVGVQFEGDAAADVIVTATCSDGQVSVVETPEADDHGGGGGGPGRG